MNIGEQIKKHRLEAKLSQRELGKKIGISQQQIAQYESGKRMPKIETIKKIASGLDVSFNELYTIVENGNEYIELDFDNPDFNKNHREYFMQLFPEIKTQISNQYKLNDLFLELNDIGQIKAIEQVEMLTKIPEYQEKKFLKKEEP